MSSYKTNNSQNKVNNSQNKVYCTNTRLQDASQLNNKSVNTSTKPTVTASTKKAVNTASTKKVVNIVDEKKEIQDDLVNKFNLVVINMIRHITEYYGDSNISQLKLVLEDIIINTPDEPIACFIMNVYKNDNYRHNILEQNDKFFLDQLDELDEFDESNKKEKETIVKMFEFKDLWYQIDDDTKNFIKKSMKALVIVSQKYILAL